MMTKVGKKQKERDKQITRLTELNQSSVTLKYMITDENYVHQQHFRQYIQGGRKKI